ncbi:hypothetical protein E1A91_A09G190500v1 [Gossypium mustelinum]|uniref:Uncharacterized protein n=1 Tax=Gossypium mustelinum TaxID=34275 RepID=A0A5D2Y0E7_GOSMU|nr:hypothetical protein E1A91_A09G190500v1 [Gossypium mustelinum]
MKQRKSMANSRSTAVQRDLVTWRLNARVSRVRPTLVPFQLVPDSSGIHKKLKQFWVCRASGFGFRIIGSWVKDLFRLISIEF